ncbi:MAG TPA: site-specific integrase [Thermoanaerobaculia bacterium]|jgi:site-specific recombinase XerD|nr:site-specific integrase [Thermoanaerobaculia bacterium]
MSDLPQRTEVPVVRVPPQAEGVISGVGQEVPVAPLQFPSLEHLDDAIHAAIERREQLQAVNQTTAMWARASYRQFRGFLAAHRERHAFVQGELRAQVVVLEDWVIAMRKRGMRRGGINTTWRGLAAAFRWLAKSSGAVNPIRFVEAPKAGRPHVSYLTRTAAEEVLRFVTHRLWRTEFERRRNAVIVGLMLLAGLRRGEVLRLRRGDVDLATGALVLRGAKGPDGGKTRVTYMPAQLRDLVSSYMEVLRTMPERQHPELLTSERNARLSSGTITRLCRIVSRQTGIHVAPHMLRHSYATLLRQAGVPDRVAMELMGHADLRMLLRYSHIEAHEPRDAAGKLTLGE